MVEFLINSKNWGTSVLTFPIITKALAYDHERQTQQLSQFLKSVLRVDLSFSFVTVDDLVMRDILCINVFEPHVTFRYFPIR